MELPLISVVVPVYNTGEYLKRTITALTNQTYKNIEIILIDDGSTDSSGKICDSFAEKDSRVKVIHQENRGVSAARNAGIDFANGEYIGFCDSDDLPDNDLYETLYRLAKENDADVSMVKYAILFVDGTVLSEQTDKLTIYDDNISMLKNLLCQENDLGIYTKLVDAKLCKSIKFDAPRKINEDKFFIFELFSKARKACYLDTCKYKYCRRENSSSMAKFSEKYLDILYFSDKIQKLTDSLFPGLSNYAAVDKVMSYMRFLQFGILLGGEKMFPEKRKEVFAYIKKADASICKKLMPKMTYIKWRIFKIGYLPFKLSVKLFTHM